MILGIATAFIVSAVLIAVTRKLDVPEIPLYILSGILVSFVYNYFDAEGFLGGELYGEGLLEQFVFVGMAFLVFFSITKFVIDNGRETALDSFKASIWVTLISFTLVAGLAGYMEYGLVESFVFGFAGAFGSSLVNVGLVREEARENHIYGWLIEDINFYQDLLALLLALAFINFYTGSTNFYSLFIALGLILIALALRKILNTLFKRYDFEEEIIMLLGISTFVFITALSETLGLTALTGVLVSGLLFINTELGFEVRERLSSIKDFFIALAFFSIGTIIKIPSNQLLLVATALVIFVTIIRPLLLLTFLSVQGYDLRTSYLAALGNNEISEITVLTTIILLPLITNEIFSTIILAFATSIIIANFSENIGKQIFESKLSDYEFDPEKQSRPSELTNHYIIAGFDDKTQQITNQLENETIIVIDYSLERIKEAEKQQLYHVLGDINSKQTWNHVNFKEAKAIISAASNPQTIQKIKKLDTKAKKILLEEKDQDKVNKRLAEKLKQALKNE